MKLVADFILVGGILAILQLIFRLFFIKRRQLPHELLIVLFISTLVIAINFYALLHDLKLLYVISFSIEDSTRFLIGALIFLYIKSFFEKKENFFLRNFKHLIPFLFYTLVFSIPIALTIYSEQYGFPYLAVLEHTQNFTFGKDLYLLTYLFLSLKLFSSYRTRMKSNYSNFTKKEFGWVKKLLIGAIIIISLDLLVALGRVFFETFDWEPGYITAISMIFFIVYLGIYGVQQTKIFLPDFLTDNPSYPLNPKTKIEKNTLLSKIEAQDLQSKLTLILDAQKPYLDQELTLLKLAQSIPCTDKKLSALLNQHMKTTFYDLINSYRVKAFKEKLLLEESQSFSILGIAYDCGF